ncbi:LTA synthase family protein [Lacticaseibacillus daqingensis]|uniref:LTA synthase family protein n=1 Tax=Lacticaseibacillus daqingensis TaxID=2486014 RepID=UPI001CDCEEB4|nr:LTA synthase family protein [Lacticaseibacillus daqingensis]
MKPLIHWLRTTRLGFLSLLLGLIWLKTLFAYYVDFTLGATGVLQQLLLFLNPLGTSAALLSLALYVRKPRRAYALGALLYVLMTALLLTNVLYYREFTDFMTVGTVMSVKNVSAGLGGSFVNMIIWRDAVYVLDVGLALLALVGYAGWNVWRFIHRQPLRWPHFGLVRDRQPVAYHVPQAVSAVAVACFGITMAVSELNRPQLLTRTFDRNYIVKYLGLTPFTVYDAFQTAQNNQVRASADSADMDKVLAYTKAHYAAPDANYFGTAKGKNVIIIHLESFQQFLIGAKIDGQEVTPFLNALIKDDNTLSFDNFFHEVGLGKTSDAENMLETSTFGLPTGSLFSSLGTDNTFQGAPALLEQYAGYTTAVFHGGEGTFWNRTNTYKSLGYNYFFDGNFYAHDSGTITEYGIKDKLMFAETSKYLEHLQQPFYAKIITTSNHYPFFITDADTDFPDAGTDDAYINGYFRTAHYLDAALKEFFAYLKASGLYDKSLIMLYGDHYGISNDRNQTLSTVLNKSTSDPTGDTGSEWTPFDDANLQRVPLIFHAPGLTGGINHTYGGEIDALPTLLHLLGVDTQNFVQFGADLLSPQHDNVVAFRNHNFVTSQYTVLGTTVYKNSTGAVVTPDAALKKQLAATQASVDTRLGLSDTLATKNLLRFYVPAGFTPVDPSKANYAKSLQSVLQTERQRGRQSTSLFSQNDENSTIDQYVTDAPEVANDRSIITDYPATVAAQASTTIPPASGTANTKSQ